MKVKYLMTVLMCIAILGCSWDSELSDESINQLDLETLPPVVDPMDNPTSEVKVALGKLLYWDPVLSGEKDVSCGSCHHPDFGYTDGLDVAIGVGGRGLATERTETAIGRIPRVGRNSPTIINAAYNGLLSTAQHYQPLKAPMFWDSRRRSLESQSLGPPTSYNEMRGDAYEEEYTYDTLVARLSSIEQYVDLFQEAFNQGDTSITQENIGKAIAAFERTLISRNSPYDQYAKGELEALNENQKQGLLLFFGKANCANCHSGPMFSDYNFYNLGIDFNQKIGEDTGVDERYEFRTPTLRNIALTAPYMHNGVHATLEDVMEFYNNGISENNQIDSIDPKIEALNLTEKEIAQIIEFMEALTDDSFDKEIPVSVPSGLKPGGDL